MDLSGCFHVQKIQKQKQKQKRIELNFPKNSRDSEFTAVLFHEMSIGNPHKSKLKHYLDMPYSYTNNSKKNGRVF